MSCVKNILFIIFLNILGLTQINAQHTDLDTVYFVKKTPFLEKILSSQGLYANINLSKDNNIIPGQGTNFAEYSQEIIKDEKNLYVNLQRTGFVFILFNQNDSILEFRRIDRTINLNYNIGCYNFLYEDQLYSYGGYGFWKTNGHLRQFNVLDKQWDIIPLNKEIFSNGYRWYSNKEGKLFVPFQDFENAGLKSIPQDQLETKTESYYLDLKQRDWIKLGRLDPSIKKILEEDPNPSGFISVQNGCLHIINDEIYYFDFIENKIYKSIKPEYNQFFIRRIGLDNTFESKGNIYFYYPSTGKIESVPFNLSNFELLNFPIWRRNTGSDKYVAFVLLFILIVFFITRFFKQKIQQRIVLSQLKHLKAKSVSQAFVGTEISLIDMLLQASLANEKIEIHQINHVLGIKDKNVGLQKKVRSDVINGINDKYQIITNGPNPLIVSVRKEDDKRFLEYFILPSEIKEIQKIINKSKNN
ncbi:MAG: hypothetical protein EBU05_01245 [Chitinophagia bacterium]|jgi:hypothetical protein|nr:hypothetical protein [Chitinophagia bacterium]